MRPFLLFIVTSFNMFSLSLLYHSILFSITKRYELFSIILFNTFIFHWNSVRSYSLFGWSLYPFFSFIYSNLAKHCLFCRCRFSFCYIKSICWFYSIPFSRNKSKNVFNQSFWNVFLPLPFSASSSLNLFNLSSICHPLSKTSTDTTPKASFKTFVHCFSFYSKNNQENLNKQGWWIMMWRGIENLRGNNPLLYSSLIRSLLLSLLFFAFFIP